MEHKKSLVKSDIFRSFGSGVGMWSLEGLRLEGRASFFPRGTKVNGAKKMNDKDLVVWKFIAWSICGVMRDGGHVAVRGCWGMGQRPM